MVSKQWLVVSGLLALAVVLVSLALAVTPVQAQDPVGGALATLAAATAQAEQWRAAQAATRSAQAAAQQAQAATQQAQVVQAEATRQAQAAQATQSALDEIERRNVAAATAQALELTATASAVEAQMMATRQAQAAQATRDGQDAEATRQAYALAFTQSQEQARVGQLLLWIAAIIAIAGVAVVGLSWARSIAQRFDVPRQVEGVVVVDARPEAYRPVLLLDRPAMPPVTMINDEATVERFSRMVEGANE